MPLLFFLIGLVTGSFLLVLAYRIPKGESFIAGRSRCDHCKKQLLWYELIPVVSFVLQKGRCRNCNNRIPSSYFFGELLTGICFALLAFRLDPNSQVINLRLSLIFLYDLFIISSLIVIFFADLYYGIIPDKITVPAIGISLLFLFIIKPDGQMGFLLSAVGGALFFILIIAATRGKGMGVGDVKLVFLMGLFLGFPGIIFSLYLAFLTGAVVSLILVIWGKKNIKSAVPFGPFLSLATLTAFFFAGILTTFAGWVLPF